MNFINLKNLKIHIKYLWCIYYSICKKKTNGIVVVLKIIEKRALEWLTETEDVLKWFYDTYERIDEDLWSGKRNEDLKEQVEQKEQDI